MRTAPPNRNPYQYFSVAADVMALRRSVKGWEVLLIQRRNPPYKGRWALPGGFLDPHEDAASAAQREFREETGLKSRKLWEFGSFSDPDRDPRGRVVTISFYTVLSNGASSTPAAGDDAANARWFSLKKLPLLLLIIEK